MKKKIKISEKYRLKAKQYRRFARTWEHMLDFSEEALMECFLWESYGKPCNQKTNGYAIGKGWMDVNISMWHEDINWYGKMFKTILEDKGVSIPIEVCQKISGDLFIEELGEEDKNLLK